MKKYLTVFLAICLLTFCGCSKDLAGTEVFSNSQFSILESGGEYYLDFKVEIPAEDSVSGAAIPSGGIHFTSLAQMKSAIERGAFTETQLKGMQRYERASNGKVAVCNINALYEPALPSGLSVDKVIWYGLPYKLWISGNGLEGEWNFTTEENNDYYLDLMTTEESKYIEFLSVTEDPERNATVKVYYSNITELTTKEIVYSYMDAEGRTVTIVEVYYEYDETKSVPDSICGIVEGNGVYCNWIFGGFTERPSLEWIKSIGIKSYVETETA